jgi:outer membrane beta-barrel protein
MFNAGKRHTGMLAWTLMAALAGVMPAVSVAQSQEGKQEQEQQREQVIKPEVDRRKIKVPRIDTENFELGAYVGTLSVEDFGANTVTGVRFDYHITEDFFLEAAYGSSTVLDSSFRQLGLPIFPQEDEDLTYYNISFGYNMFPGEIFFGKKRAWTSAVYIIGGIGNTEFIGENMSTFNIGIGVRLLPTDFLTLRFDIHDYLWDSDLLGSNKLTHNFEATFGLGFFF